MSINFEDFKKVELKIAKILTAERVEGSEKLIKLEISLGINPSTGLDIKRQIVAGIGLNHTPENLIGKQITVVVNLEPRKLMGLESQGMLLATSGENGPVLIIPESETLPGSEIR